ncbi:hypothetical protein NFI96_006410 [Prochilodus magdalenae]|nr:hypothetical protein NFI96_006410 [Prochilodus magdalenae]
MLGNSSLPAGAMVSAESAEEMSEAVCGGQLEAEPVLPGSFMSHRGSPGGAEHGRSGLDQGGDPLILAVRKKLNTLHHFSLLSLQFPSPGNRTVPSEPAASREKPGPGLLLRARFLNAGSMNLTELNQTDRCSGFSCPERSVSPVYVFLYVCAAAVVLLTVCGNLLVIVSVCHFKQLHTPTNMLILSLAASDFLVGVFVLPLQLSRLTESCWVFGPTMCTFYICISFFVTSISIYNVALIAVDRYLAISNPFLYIEKASVSAACVVVSCNWFLLMSYNSAVLYFNGDSTGLMACPEMCLFVLHEVWSLIDLLIAFVIPCSMIIIFYGLVFIIAKKHAHAIRDLSIQTASKSTVDSMKSQRKAAKVLSVLVVVFLACLFPYFLCALQNPGAVLWERMLNAGSMNLTELNQTDRCSGFSCPERSVSPVYVFLYVCAAAVVLLTVCGNLLVIVSVCHFKQLHTPTNMLILSLAASDFLVGVFVLPLQLSRLTESCWVFGPTMCTFYVFVSFFSTSISIYNVALIAVDRYLAISNPFLYTEKASVSAACVVVSCNWFLLMSYNSAVLYFNGKATGLIACPEECLFVLHEVWSLIDLLIAFVIPCSMILIFYGLVFIIAKKHAHAIRDLSVHTNAQASKSTKASVKSEWKAAKVLSVLVTVFLACLLPYFVYALISNAIEADVFDSLDTTNWTPPTGHHQLDTINRTPPTGHHQLDTINWTPSTGHHQLDTTNWTPSTGHHQQDTTNWTPSTGHHQQDTINWTPLTEHHQQNTTNWTPSTEHHQLDNINRTPPTGNHQQNTINWTPLTEHHQLDTTNWTPSTEHHQLDTINRTPSTGHHQQDTINWTPSTEHHQLDTINRTPPTGHHQQNTTNWTPSTEHHQLDNINRTPPTGNHKLDRTPNGHHQQNTISSAAQNASQFPIALEKLPRSVIKSGGVLTQGISESPADQERSKPGSLNQYKYNISRNRVKGGRALGRWGAVELDAAVVGVACEDFLLRLSLCCLKTKT